MATCVSYPKSGRTWLRVMLAELGAPIEFTHLKTGADGWGRRIEQIPPPSCDDYKIVFLHRDPRDTVVSFYYEMTRRQILPVGRKLRYLIQGRMPPRELAEFIHSPRFGIEKTIWFNLQCAERLNALPISYEHLRSSPVEELSSILAFIGRDVDRATIELVVQNNTFQKMREREAAGAYDTERLRATNPKDADSFKVRKGKIGGWRDEMDASTQDYARGLLERYQYFERMAELTAR